MVSFNSCGVPLRAFMQLTWTANCLRETYGKLEFGNEHGVSYLPLSHMAAQVSGESHFDLSSASISDRAIVFHPTGGVCVFVSIIDGRYIPIHQYWRHSSLCTT